MKHDDGYLNEEHKRDALRGERRAVVEALYYSDIFPEIESEREFRGLLAEKAGVASATFDDVLRAKAGKNLSRDKIRNLIRFLREAGAFDDVESDECISERDFRWFSSDAEYEVVKRFMRALDRKSLLADEGARDKQPHVSAEDGFATERERRQAHTIASLLDLIRELTGPVVLDSNQKDAPLIYEPPAL